MQKEANQGFRGQTTRHSADFEGPDGAELKIPALTVLAHPIVDRVGDMVTLPALAAGRQVELSRLTPKFAQPGSNDKAPLEETHLSRKPVLLLPGQGDGEITLARVTSSTRIEVGGVEPGASHTFTAAELERGAVIVLGRRVVLALHYHHPVAIDLPSFGLIGESTAMVRVRSEIALLAGLDVPVLLRGESGTGKELIARAIHASSPRSEHGILPVNMAALPSSLAAAELFGAARGAFTGASHKRNGYFSRADQGTLFLDEVGDTPPDVQPLLLRALESGEIQPVGADAPRRVDVRLISATDADLEKLIADQGFREQLHHRLAGYEIHVPPLRDRLADFGRLLFHFLDQELQEVGLESSEGFRHQGRPWPPADLVARLAEERWSGNVRQLRNAARRLVLARLGGAELGVGLISSLLERSKSSGPSTSSDGQLLGLASAPTPAKASATGAVSPGWRPAYRKPSEVTAEELLATLREHRYGLQRTAEALKISRGSLYNLMRAHPGIRQPADLGSAEIRAALAAVDGDIETAALQLEVSPHGLKLRIEALGLR